jgi:8-oxo-dGTP diphosphatase
MRREYPQAPIVAVGAVILREDKVLLIRRRNPPSQGQWTIPGGVMELGETFQEAARREVREECGLEVEPGPVVEVVQNIVRDEAGAVRYHYVIVDVLAEVTGGTLQADEDAADARWVGEEELEQLELTKSARPLLRRILPGCVQSFRGRLPHPAPNPRPSPNRRGEGAGGEERFT